MAAIERLQRGAAGRNAKHPRACRFEAQPQRLPDARVIVDHQGGHGGPLVETGPRTSC